MNGAAGGSAAGGVHSSPTPVAPVPPLARLKGADACRVTTAVRAADEAKSALAAGASTFGRNFLLTYNIRAGVGLVLHLLGTARRKPRSLTSLRDLVSEGSLVFREDAVRLGLFVGGFTGIFVAAERLLKLLFPPPPGSEVEAGPAGAARGAAGEDGPGSSATDKPATWHTFVAGTMGGLSLLALDGERRRTLALYVWARALQGLYNAAKARGWWHFWGSHWRHGDSLLFILSSAQVLYAYAMRPETLPPSYYRFMLTTAPIADYVLQVTRRSIRGQPIDVQKVLQYAKKRGAIMDPPPISNPFTPVIPCSVLHPHNHLCRDQLRQTFTDAFRRTFPLYFSLQFVPAALLRMGRFLSSPLRVLWSCVKSATQSTTFLATFVATYMGVICLQRKVVVRDSKYIYYIAGLVAATSIFIEKKSRRSELALYVFPRAADSLFMIMRDHRLLYGFPNGDIALFALSMGCVMHFFRHERKTMSGIFAKIMSRFLEQVPAEAEAALDTPRSERSAGGTEASSRSAGSNSGVIAVPSITPPLLNGTT